MRRLVAVALLVGAGQWGRDNANRGPGQTRVLGLTMTDGQHATQDVRIR